MAKILVVDDEDGIRDIVRRYLEKHGHAVHTAEDGLQGLRKAREIFPDLIVLDIMMPQLDGFAVSENLKSDPSLSKIPVLMLTAQSDDRSRLFADETAVDDYMTKPFTEADLLSRVNDLLHRKRVRVGHHRQDFRVKPRTGLLYVPAILAFVFLSIGVAPVALKILAGAPEENGAGWTEKTAALSQQSDLLFMVMVPIALILFVYQTILLGKMARSRKD